MLSCVRDEDLRLVGFDFDERFMHVQLNDGRTISIPLEWYPTLVKATDAQRRNYELDHDGEGAHWPDIDEDLSLKSFLLGNPAAKSEEYWRRFRPQSAFVAVDLDILEVLDTTDKVNSALREYLRHLHRGAAG